MKPLPLACAAGGVVALGGWLGYRGQEPTTLTFLAVGQGDCAVLQHGGRTVLIDAGPRVGGFDAGERIVVPRLRAMGVERVDLVVLTHPDMDHVGGTPAILRAHPEARVAMSAEYRDDPEMRQHLKDWRLDPGRVTWIPKEARAEVGPVRLQFYSPPYDQGQDSNVGSTFLRITTPEGASAVLTGDAPWEAELQSMRGRDWTAQVLKAGHHGSRGSSAPAFLRAVRPSWLVVSCGRENMYGHPAPEVLQRAEEVGAEVARTDQEGDVAFALREGRFVRVR